MKRGASEIRPSSMNRKWETEEVPAKFRLEGNKALYVVKQKRKSVTNKLELTSQKNVFCIFTINVIF